MDAAGVESLRALFAEFPSDEKSSQVVRAWDRHFEYENDVLAALRHRFGPLASKPGSDFGADAVMTIGSHKLVVEVKQLVPNQHILDRQAKRLRMVMDREGLTVQLSSRLRHRWVLLRTQSFPRISTS